MSQRKWNPVWWLLHDGEEILRWRPKPPYLFGDEAFIARLWAHSDSLGGHELLTPTGPRLFFEPRDRYAIYFLCLLMLEGEEGYEYGGAVPDLSDTWMTREDQIPSLIREIVY